MPRRNPVLRSQARKIIHNVVNFMQKEKEIGVRNVGQVQKRAAEATGTSVRTISNIISEVKIYGIIRTPGKKRNKPKPITGLDAFAKAVIKRNILHFHVTEKEMPTMNKILAKLKADINFKGSRTSLITIIRELGFRWQRTENKKKILIEKHDIRLKRIQYLQKIQQYREEGRPIVFTGETNVYSVHTKFKACSHDSNKGLKSTVSKYQSVVMVHAGYEDGFVPNALFMFESETKTGDYQVDMNFTTYEKWLRTKLIPNIRPDSVVVIGNAPYHSALKDPAPTSTSKKSDMMLWLDQRGIPYNTNMLKPELYNLICQNNITNKSYLVDDILAEHNLIVLRLPSHPDLNPLDMAGAAVKGYILEKKVSDFNVTRIMQLVEEKVNKMGQDAWVATCDVVKNIENQYRTSDLVVDEMTDKFIINAEDTSESQSDSEKEEESDLSDSDESDMDVNVSVLRYCQTQLE